jgi:hypothetical protein
MATTRILIIGDQVDTRLLLILRRQCSQAAVAVPFPRNSHKSQAE